MNELAAGSATALWLGVLTAISPCPLATNIAAISFIGRDVGSSWRVLASGLAYTLGRILAYVVVAALLITSVLSIPSLASFLQTRMNQVLGPLLIVMGVLALGWVRLPVSIAPAGESVRLRAARAGAAGAGLLGILFALSFCPLSAGLFFGNLIPLSVEAGSRLLLPAMYGIGTGIPVVAFAVMIALGAGSVGRAFNLLTALERWARRLTGAVFILVGIYLSLTQLFGVNL